MPQLLGPSFGDEVFGDLRVALGPAQSGFLVNGRHWLAMADSEGNEFCVGAGPGTSAVLSKTKQASAESTGQFDRRSDEPDRLVAETGCPCSVGSKERRHNRILHIAWRADRIERKQ